MHDIFQNIYSTMRCPFHHRWQLVRESSDETEHVCQKCGKRVTRHFDLPTRSIPLARAA